MDKNLMLENKNTKPQIKTFNNETKILLHKEYDKLLVIEDLVHNAPGK